MGTDSKSTTRYRSSREPHSAANQTLFSRAGISEIQLRLTPALQALTHSFVRFKDGNFTLPDSITDPQTRAQYSKAHIIDDIKKLGAMMREAASTDEQNNHIGLSTHSTFDARAASLLDGNDENLTDLELGAYAMGVLATHYGVNRVFDTKSTHKIDTVFSSKAKIDDYFNPTEALKVARELIRDNADLTGAPKRTEEEGKNADASFVQNTTNITKRPL